MDAALAAAATAAGGGDEAVGAANPVASWAVKERERLRLEAEAAEKAQRLRLFASDFELLGIDLGRAPDLDEKTLRKAFRERSRVLHPDAQVRTKGSDDGGGSVDNEFDDSEEKFPSVYELNAAYDNLKKLL